MFLATHPYAKMVVFAQITTGTTGTWTISDATATAWIIMESYVKYVMN